MTMGPGCAEKEVDIFEASARKERCISHTCGFTCAKDRLCGWSSTQSKCVAGGKTSKNELSEGVCETAVCSDFKCGATCASQFGCGWNTAKMQCMGGEDRRQRWSYHFIFVVCHFACIVAELSNFFRYDLTLPEHVFATQERKQAKRK